MTTTKATTGLSVTHLTFKPHHLVEMAQHMLDRGNGSPDLRTFYEEWLTAKHAEVTFANGWVVSIITMTPRDRFSIFHADERIPTYEVAVFRPDFQMVGSPHNWLTVSEVDALLHTVMSKPKGRNRTV